MSKLTDTLASNNTGPARILTYVGLLVGGVVGAVVDINDAGQVLTGFGLALAGLSGVLAEITDKEVADIKRRLDNLDGGDSAPAIKPTIPGAAPPDDVPVTTDRR